MPILYNQEWDQNGNLISEEIIEIPYRQLSGIELAATLNVVLGIWTLKEASDITRLPQEHLIAEAQAWAVAMEANK